MEEMQTVTTLTDLTALVEKEPQLYIRWSKGPEADMAGSSFDDLTGVSLPGLSASPLAVEPWWGERPLRLWVARRLYDYSHLQWEKGPGVYPWVLKGEETGRGPDNEPLVRSLHPVAWVAEGVLTEARRLVEEQNLDWGPLNRPRPS